MTVHRRLPVALLAVTVVAWVIADQWDPLGHRPLSDLPVYQDAARAFTGGQVLYRDIPFEYPPLAAGLLTFARLLPLSYAGAFSLLMLLALCATVLATVAIARALGLDPRRQALAGGAVAVVPLLLGDFVATRFDLAVAALVAWTLWAAISDRLPLAWGLLAAAVALKLAPIVLVPLLVVWHRHQRRGARTAFTSAGIAGLTVAATFLPFAALSPGGVWNMFEYHIDRPLQIESLGSAYLLGLHALADIGLRVETTFGSQNLVGGGPDVIAALSTALVVVAIAAVCATAAILLRRTPRPEGAHLFVTACAATLAVSVAGGKVLSPQFLVWLLPAALLVTGRYARAAAVVTVCALVATQLYFPVRYWDLVALETPPIVLLVIRDALLVALVALTWPRPHPAPLGAAAPLAARPSAAHH